MTPAYHRKEGWGGWHLPTIKRKMQLRILEFTLQYDGRPDGRFGVWVGIFWDVEFR